MKNIRTFIVCTSLLLVAWLSAAYTAQLDNRDALTEVRSASETAAHKQDSTKKKERVPPTAAFAGIE